MTPGEKPYICYRGRKYRDRERRLQITYREGDCVPVVDTEQEEPVVDAEQEDPMVDAEQDPAVDSEQEVPMADDSDAKRFGEALLKSVQDLSRQIEMMGQRFTPVEAR